MNDTENGGVARARGEMGAREGSSRRACRYLQVGDPVLDQIREIYGLLHSPVAHAVHLAEVVEVCHDGPADRGVTLVTTLQHTRIFGTARREDGEHDGRLPGTERDI